MQSNHLSSQFFSLASRNYLWAGATALSIAGMALLSSTVMVKHPLQKLFLCTSAAGFFGAALATRHQYRMARDMFSASEGAAMMGWAEEQVKKFAPIDQRGFDDGSGGEVEEDYSDEWAEETIAIENLLIKRLLLAAGAYDIRCKYLGEEDLDDRFRVFVELPTGVAVRKLQGLAVDIASKAGIDGELEISAVPGGVAIDLLKEVEYAEPVAPKTETPKPDLVAVEDKDSEEARKAASNRLPDGALLIQAAALNDFSRYPVVMVIAGQGTGKTATLNWILTQLLGYKVIASPKPLSGVSQGGVDLIYGFDKTRKQWLNFGKFDETDFSEDKDLSSYLATEEKVAGSMLDFVWACKRESMNRQLNQAQKPTPWRCVFDESAYTYLSGYDDPLAQNSAKVMKKAQELIASCNRDAFMNYRGQGLQTFFGSQVATVDAIGLKGFAAARDEAWWLYPGLAAINEADRLERFQLKQWLQRRVKAGFGVAIMVKQDSIVEVINMPTLEVLEKFSHD